jgi:thymidine kinase
MAGWVHVITGEMFSGKSEALALRIRQAVLGGERVQVFYPDLASRASARDIEQRAAALGLKISIDSVPAHDAQQLYRQVRVDTTVVAIDEAQFFSRDLVQVVKCLRRAGKMIWIAGLDQDYLGHPFGCMGDLLCIANTIEKRHAWCARCHKAPALLSQRLSADTAQVAIGDTQYVPVCEDCYQEAGIPLSLD